MSLTCDMLLVTFEYSGLTSPALEKFHAWCREHAPRQGFLPLDTETAGGPKVFTETVLACAGNYFPWRELLEAMPSFGWEERTTLVVHPEQSRGYVWTCPGP